MDAAGNFTVTWMSFGQDGDSTAESNIYAREYDAAGTALGSAFRVNTTTSTNQQFSAVTRTAAGDYIIVWSGNIGDATGVFGQRYYVNKPPVVNATASDTGTEDTDVVYTHAQLMTLIGATDVDDANANLSISITNINNGTLVMSGGSGGAGTTFTFTPTANFTGNLTFDYQVSDDESPTQATSAVGTATVALSAVNDAPVAREDRIGLVFDGVDDYVRIGDYAGLNVTNAVTMEAWIRPSGAGTGTQIIVNKEGEYEVAITADTGEIIWAFANTDPGWGWHNTRLLRPGR